MKKFLGLFLAMFISYTALAGVETLSQGEVTQQDQQTPCVTVKDGKTSTLEFYSESFDYCGYDAFKAQHQNDGDATEEFFNKYAGAFPEEERNSKVNGYLAIDAIKNQIQLKVEDNHKLNKDLCSIQFMVPAQKVTTNKYGYIVWFSKSAFSKELTDCLLGRIEIFSIFEKDSSIGIAFDYWNANQLRLSLKDAYIFFERK